MAEKRPARALLLDIVDRPGQALANISAYPRWRWILPAILAVSVLVASAVLTAPLVADRSQELMAEQLSRLSADQANLVRQQMERFQTPLFLGLTSVATGVLFLSLLWLAQSTILYFGVLVMGGEADFGHTFAAMPWLYLPFVLETALQTAFVLYRGELIVNEGLSYLASTGRTADDMRNLAYVALSQVSLFRLWHLVLVYVFLRVVARLGNGSSVLLTVIYFALLLGAQLALTGLSAALTPAP